MLTSGTAAVVTNGDAAVTLIDNTNSRPFHHLTIVNGAVAGFFSLDGGTTWCRLPASTTLQLRDLRGHVGSVTVKRIASGTDLADVYGFAW